jgi:hypothetical protein
MQKTHPLQLIRSTVPASRVDQKEHDTHIPFPGSFPSGASAAAAAAAATAAATAATVTPKVKAPSARQHISGNHHAISWQLDLAEHFAFSLPEPIEMRAACRALAGLLAKICHLDGHSRQEPAIKTTRQPASRPKLSWPSESSRVVEQ